MGRFKDNKENRMNIYNSYMEALQNLSDETICFKDEDRKIIITLTPVAMDGSLECKIFPLSQEEVIADDEACISDVKGMIYHNWLDAYFGEDADEEQEHFVDELEALLATFDKGRS